MVIISTSALDVIIHAVSPESILGGAGVAVAAGAVAAASAGAPGAPGAAGAAVAAGGAASGAGAPCANAAPLKTISAAAPATNVRPSHFVMLFIMLSPRMSVLALIARHCRFRRCECARLDRPW